MYLLRRLRYIWRPIPFRNSMLFSLRWPSPRPIDGFTFFLRFSGVHWKRLVNCLTVTPNVWYTFFKGAKKSCWTEPSDLFSVLWMKTGSLHAIVVKKTHSIKNNLLCTNNLRIVWLSSTYKGHVHDKKICDEEPLLLPKGIRLWQDTGFIGHKPDGVEICMPKKKPKGKELTCVEKQENKRISGVRIKVEHAIGGMKKCRIVKERFRCHKFGFEDMVILIACGLHNFRISHKMSHITN